MPSPKLIPLLLALIGLTLLIFGIWPGIDLVVTGYFHDANGFPVRSNAGIETLRNLLWDASLLIPLLALILAALAGWLRRPVLALSARVWGFVLLLFLLGPGLLVYLDALKRRQFLDAWRSSVEPSGR